MIGSVAGSVSHGSQLALRVTSPGATLLRVPGPLGLLVLARRPRLSAIVSAAHNMES
jgi:hypothetical protein